MPNLYRYELDPTGALVSNLVKDEVHDLNVAQIRACTTSYGAYFGDSLRAYDHITNRLLVNTVDYELIELLEEPTLLYAKPIYTMLVIRNPSVSSKIRLTYQVLGGYYQYNHVNLNALVEAALNDMRPVDWNNGVINKPLGYPPTAHPHTGEDLNGLGPLVVALERLSNTIGMGSNQEFNRLVEWVAKYVQNPDTATLEETLLGTAGNKPINAENMSIALERLVNKVRHVLYFAEANFTTSSLMVSTVLQTNGLPDGTKFKWSFYNDTVPISVTTTTLKNNSSAINVAVPKTLKYLTCVLEESIRGVWVKVKTIRQPLAPVIDIDNIATLLGSTCSYCATSATQFFFHDR